MTVDQSNTKYWAMFITLLLHPLILRIKVFATVFLHNKVFLFLLQTNKKKGFPLMTHYVLIPLDLHPAFWSKRYNSFCLHHAIAQPHFLRTIYPHAIHSSIYGDIKQLMLGNNKLLHLL